MKQILAGIAMLFLSYMAVGAIDQYVEQQDSQTIHTAINK